MWLWIVIFGSDAIKDRKFLTEGGVFTYDQIDAYIELKFQEIYKFEHTPHPIEFEMYYSD